jgi:hypothetical protein
MNEINRDRMNKHQKKGLIISVLFIAAAAYSARWFAVGTWTLDRSCFVSDGVIRNLGSLCCVKGNAQLGLEGFKSFGESSRGRFSYSSA